MGRQDSDKAVFTSLNCLYRSARATVLIMMQKDEDHLLDLWIAYHSPLVGIENIYIIDDCSSSEITLASLERARERGAHLLRLTNANCNNLDRKGQIVEKLIKELFFTLSEHIHCIIPMDCDEFLVGDFDGLLTCDVDSIQSEIKSLSSGLIFYTARRLNNAPWSRSQYLPLGDERPRKLLFCSSSFSDLDIGFHHCKTPVPRIESHLSYIHLHNRPFSELVERARLKLKGRVDISDNSSLVKYNGPGWHLSRYLSMTESGWIAELRQQKMIEADAFARRLCELGLEYPYPTSGTGE